MLFYAGKILQELVYPFNWAILGLFVSLWCLRKGKTRCAAAANVASLVLLVAPGVAVVGDMLIRELESVHPTYRSVDYPRADAIVVLGGSTVETLPPRVEAEEMGGCRLQMAARLYHAKKADRIVVTGGGFYYLPDASRRTEAEDMRDVLLIYQVPESVIQMESESQNTDQNAERTAAMLKPRGINHILLVTSAFHTRRAVPLFERHGFQVTAVPTSHMATDSAWYFRKLYPTPSGLVRTSTALKEHLGYLAYKVLGKI